MSRIVRATLAIGASLAVLAGGASAAYADGDSSAADAAARAAAAAAKAADEARAKEAARAAAAAAADAAETARANAAEAKARAEMPETVVTLKAAHSGKCLEIDKGKKDNGAKAQQGECNSGDAQKWRVVPVANSSFELRSVPSGKCLEVADSGTKAGAVVQQWSCVANAKQMRWQIVLVDPVRKLHQLRPTHTEDRCLDIADAKKDNGAKAQQWSCNETDAQLWQIQPVK
ncbi:RICIN domain-containing protein [Streptomyces sp. NPDC046261]|uniref:RICIN domain-containing protein n=1 Tax=Streptomyces sp. NPDC046261 TaxID=3157200 RepID=UPI0033E3D25D